MSARGRESGLPSLPPCPHIPGPHRLMVYLAAIMLIKQPTYMPTISLTRLAFKTIFGFLIPTVFKLNFRFACCIIIEVLKYWPVNLSFMEIEL